jgi:hypothetical protein
MRILLGERVVEFWVKRLVAALPTLYDRESSILVFVAGMVEEFKGVLGNEPNVVDGCFLFLDTTALAVVA